MHHALSGVFTMIAAEFVVSSEAMGQRMNETRATTDKIQHEAHVESEPHVPVMRS